MQTTNPALRQARAPLGAVMAVLGMLLLTASATASTEPPKSAEDIQPALIGSTAPDTAVVTVDGQESTLHEVLLGKKTVLIFYRGGW